MTKYSVRDRKQAPEGHAGTGGLNRSKPFVRLPRLSGVRVLARRFLTGNHNSASLFFRFVVFAPLSSRLHRINLPRKTSLALGLFGNIRSLEVLHLLPQLRIHFVRDGHNARKQRIEFQILHVLVQRRKNADLKQARLLY